MSSPPETRPYLIAAVSGRALAAAAQRAGARVIVLDRFADQDTEALALACTALPWEAQGFARAALIAAVERCHDDVEGLVYGAGFERDPNLLAELSRIVRILGNWPDTVAAIKNPLSFATLLARLGLPHPPTQGRPPKSEGWLRKAIGGAGGRHIGLAAAGPAEPGYYYQRAVGGRGVSAAFLADGRAARVVGFTEQWCSGTEAAPFRYGGCAGPVHLSSSLTGEIETACDAIAGAIGLVGLNSLDLLVAGEEFHIIEVNPRPGATLDVLDGIDGQTLWRMHLEAVDGRLPRTLILGGIASRAATVVYAPQPLTITDRMVWPPWSTDRGKPGTIIEPGEPVATVHATGRSAAAARLKVERRAGQLLAAVARQHPRPVSGGQDAAGSAYAQRQ